jgi:FAD/FMN-containing dehydrogenase
MPAALSDAPNARAAPRWPAGIAGTTDDALRHAFAQDDSGKIGQPPSGILQPRSTGDIQAIVRWAGRAGQRLVPVSSGPGPRRHGDTVCAQQAVVVDCSGMQRILHVDGRDAVAIIEAGVTFGQLDAALAPHGLRSIKPLLPRRSKSVVASLLDREPTTVPRLHWDSADPLVAMEVVFGSGDIFRTGSASLPGTLEENLARGNRQLISFGPGQTDFGRVLQGSQGALAIVSWASVYCERIPVRQIPFFAVADTLAPVMQLAQRLAWRRGGSQLYIVNATQLALMLAPDARRFAELRAALPAWTLFFELTASSYFPAESMAWQRADLVADAQAAGTRLTETLDGGVSAAQVSALREAEPPMHYTSRAWPGSAAVFFLTQPGRLVDQLQALAPLGLDAADIGVYLQPLVQGVNAHCELTLPAGTAARARPAAERLAANGAFFSRPCHPWADVPFARDAGIRALLARTKAIFDPSHVLQPGSQALGGAA